MGVFDNTSKTTGSSSSDTSGTTSSNSAQSGTSQQQGTSNTQVTGGTQSTVPTFLAQHQADVVGSIGSAANNAQVAGLADDEQAAIQQARAAQGNWTPGLSSAINLATNAATTPASAGIKNYMDPFQQQVMDDVQRRAHQSFRNNLGGLAGAAIGQGGFGGSRHSQAIGQAAAQSSADVAGELAKLGSQGWNTALGASQADLARQSTGANQLANFANQAQTQGQSDVKQLMDLGGVQRGLQQKAYDLPLDTLQKAANIGTTVGNNVGRGSTNWSNTSGQTGSTGATTSNTAQTGATTGRTNSTNQSEQIGGTSKAAQLMGMMGLFGNNAGGISQLFGGQGGMGGLLNQGAQAVKGLFGGSGNILGGGGGDSQGGFLGEEPWTATPGFEGYEPGYLDDMGIEEPFWGGDFDWADDGTVTPFGNPANDPLAALQQQLSQQVQQDQQKFDKSLEEPSLFAEGGMAQGDDMDPMQALDALAQAGVPPELLQQCAQALQGGGGGPEAGGMPPGAGGPPPGGPAGPMACGGLAHAAHGGMMHMAGGGGAYGIDPAMIQRLMAASGGRNPMGGQSANPMAPGHMGAGPQMGQGMPMDPNNVVNERRRREAMFTRGQGMAQGGLSHMAGGGGAYGIDPAMIQRLMAASGGRNPMGGQSANPMAPGHMGAGPAQTSSMGGGQGPMSREEAMRRRVQTQMHGMQ